MGLGFLGDLFDLNRDGDLDWMEQATEFAFLEDMMEQESEEDEDCEDEN